MLQTFMLLVFAWIATLSGVLLGGLLVFRTKKEAYEPFLQVKKQPEEQAFNLEDEFDVEEAKELPDIITKMNEKLKSQMGG